MDGVLFSPSHAGSRNTSQLAFSLRDWDFHTVRGGIGAGSHRFRPQAVGAGDVWNNVWLK